MNSREFAYRFERSIDRKGWDEDRSKDLAGNINLPEIFVRGMIGSRCSSARSRGNIYLHASACQGRRGCEDAGSVINFRFAAWLIVRADVRQLLETESTLVDITRSRNIRKKREIGYFFHGTANYAIPSLHCQLTRHFRRPRFHSLCDFVGLANKKYLHFFSNRCTRILKCN